MKHFPNVLSSGTCEVITTNRFTCLSQNNDMEIPINEPNQASVSDITTSQYDDECTTLSLETDLDPKTELTFESKGLHFCNLNIQHIVSKMDELRITMAHEHSPDIFGMCETFLTSSVSDDQVAVDGFDLIRKDRSDTQNKAGGGVILYYRKSINCKRKCDLEISNIETLWAEIALPNSKPFLICSVYRPPSSTSDWIDLFEEELSIAQTTGLEVIVMGDFNIDLSINTNRKWLNLIELFDLSQLISEPTRVTEKSSTTIDHVYTSHPENISESFVSHYSISDHFPVCFSRKINNKISKSDHITTSYRSFKTFNEDAFINDLSGDLNRFTVGPQSDINDDLMIWYSIFLKHLDHHAPYKTKRVKSKKLPDWYNDEIALTRKKRDACKQRQSWAEYKKYRNKTKDLIRKAKRKHFSDSVTQSKDTRAIWQHFRKINNNDKSSDSSLPDEIVINNERCTSSEKVATKLNEYFSSISNIFGIDNRDSTDPDLTHLTNFVNDKVPNGVYFQIPNITQEQVSASIMALDSSKAIGLDGIGPRIIKSVANILSLSIAALINKSIATGKFPDKLKLAKVFPIHKSGSKSDPCNYRPISILPTISKIFEKHVNKHLMAYMNKYNIIHESQSGFRRKHSCQTALVKLIDQWMAGIDKGDTIGSMFIDFRKAFDLVDHKILIQKLAAYILSRSSLIWFISYLESRQQTIQYDKGMTTFSNILSGVPQGSILGPTLFLLFVNDLPLFLKHCYCDLFADDATIHTSSSDKNAINEEISTDLLQIVYWSQRNKLPINFDKTTYMLIRARKRINDTDNLELNVGETNIKQVSKQ